MKQEASIHAPILNHKLGKEAMFSILSALLILLAGYLWEIPMFYGADNTFVYSPGFFYVGSVLEFLFGAFLIWYGVKEFGVKRKNILLIALCAVALSNAIASLSLNEVVTPPYATHPYSFPLDFRFMVAISGIDTMFGIYYLFGVMPYALKNKKIMAIFLEGIIGIALAAIIYSYFQEADTYKAIFDHGFLYNERILSFTGHPNRIGFDIMAAIFAEMYMLHMYRQRWRYIPMAYLAVSLLFTLSKTAIIVIFLAGVLFLFYRAAHDFRHKHKIMGAIALLFGVLALSFIVLLMVGVFPEESFLGTLAKQIKDNLYGEDPESMITGRGQVWKDCWSLISLSPFRVIFGYGRGNYSLLLYEAMHFGVFNIKTGQSHNAFIEVLGEFGMIGLAAYLFLGGIYVYLCVKGAIKHKRGVILCAMIFMTSLLRQFSECPGYFDLRYEGIAMSLLCILPVLAPSDEGEEEKLSKTLAYQGVSSLWALIGLCPALIGVASFAPGFGPLFYFIAFLCPILPLFIKPLGFSWKDSLLLLGLDLATLVLVSFLPPNIHDGSHALYFALPGILSLFYFLLRPYVALKPKEKSS